MRELWQKNTTFLRSVSIIRKDFVSLPTDSVTIRSKDILNSEALCFILTKHLQGFSGPPLQNIDMRSALQYK